MRNIKFRVWDIKNQNWIPDNGCLSSSGPLFTLINGKIKRLAAKNHVVQFWSGLLDKHKNEVYDGDIIKFIYSPGDFAWEYMDDEQRERNLEITGREFIGTVKSYMPVHDGINLSIVSHSHGLEMIFPISYCQRGEVIGNIFKNGELLKL